MSDLLNLMRAVVDQSASTLLRAVREDMVLQEERPVFNFLRSFHQQHGTLPTLTTLQQNGILLPEVTEPASYYLQRVRHRFAYNQVSRHYPQVHGAMARRDMPAVVQHMRDCLHSVASTLSPQSYASIGQVADWVEQEFEAARLAMGTLQGVPLGYPTIDNTLGGARGGDLIVVAGRPGMGKSYMMLQMADAAWSAGYATGFVTMEMSTSELGTRWASMHSGANPEWISRGQLDIHEARELRRVLNSMRQTGAQIPLHFMAGDFAKEVQAVEDFILEHSPAILFIDSAYLLNGGSRQGVARWENISSVIEQLKQLALRYNIPIVISVQLNRNVRSAQQTELDLGDVAGSDSIPQAATAVFGIRHGVPPFENVRRHIQCLKSRRGRSTDFDMYFSFHPVNFQECPPEDSIGGAPMDVSFML